MEAVVRLLLTVNNFVAIRDVDVDLERNTLLGLWEVQFQHVDFCLSKVLKLLSVHLGLLGGSSFHSHFIDQVIAFLNLGSGILLWLSWLWGKRRACLESVVIIRVSTLSIRVLWETGAIWNVVFVLSSGNLGQNFLYKSFDKHFQSLFSVKWQSPFKHSNKCFITTVSDNLVG